MSESKQEISASPAKTEIKVDAAHPVVEPIKDVPKPKSKGFSNPALKAMGIPTLRLPSRNWMIFWLVVSAGTGGIVYDKYQQSQLRKKWMKRVESLGERPLGPNELARKVTIYVAPPPSDYLDESLAVFRQYVKPILNAGGVDYTIQSENRQGVIRSIVAADVRALRREILANELELKKLEESQKWFNRVKHWFSKKSTNDDEIKDKLFTKQKQDQFDYSNLLGVYYKNTHKGEPIINEDSEMVDPSSNGGVICIGRGAYKEYLHGLHEGLLGPLHKPIENNEFELANNQNLEKNVEVNNNTVEQIDIKAPVVEDINNFNKEKTEAGEQTEETETSSNVESVSMVNDQEIKKEEENKEDAELDANGEKLLPVPKPFIKAEDYSTAQFAPEFNFNSNIPTKDRVSPVFQQAIMVIPVYHLLGFLNTPQRIYRFYTRRYLTDEYGKRTVAVVENLRSPFKIEDVELGKDEEADWPTKWVKSGIEKNSEWIQELKTDDRVLGKLTIFDAGKVFERENEEK